MAADKETTKIESARKSGQALTGSDFGSSSSKAALSGLLKSDRSKNMSAMDLAGQEQQRRRTNRTSYKRGGMVKTTGKALLHKGEKVITKAQVKKMKK